MEFEAFVLNEMCQFTGAFCNSLHCDEMGYLCRVSYWLGTVRNGDAVPEKINGSSGAGVGSGTGSESI